MEISPIFALLVPIVVGVVQVAKKSGLASKWAALLSLVLGVGGTFLVVGHLAVLEGLVVGLAASGLWSGVKATVAQ